jgi:hypothetical protein
MTIAVAPGKADPSAAAKGMIMTDLLAQLQEREAAAAAEATEREFHRLAHAVAVEDETINIDTVQELLGNFGKTSAEFAKLVGLYSRRGEIQHHIAEALSHDEEEQQLRGSIEVANADLESARVKHAGIVRSAQTRLAEIQAGKSMARSLMRELAETRSYTAKIAKTPSPRINRNANGE